MRPAQQGAFDGLCGVYSIINALDLCGAPHRRSGIHADLFDELTHSLGAATLLTSGRDGIDAAELTRAAKIAFAWLVTAHGLELEVTQPFARRRFKNVGQFVRSLDRVVTSPDAAAIISFKRDGRSHWTVVKAIGDEAIQLRDSAGLSELSLSPFTLNRGPAHFRTASTLEVRRRR